MSIKVPGNSEAHGMTMIPFGADRRKIKACHGSPHSFTTRIFDRNSGKERGSCMLALGSSLELQNYNVIGPYSRDFADLVDLKLRRVLKSKEEIRST